MRQSSSRAAVVFFLILGISGALPWAAPAQRGQGGSGAPQEPRFTSLTIGETTRVQGATDMFERVFFPVPEGDKLTAGAFWDFSPDVAIKLGRLKGDEQKIERWRVIRRNLGLSPDDSKDWILWKEVVDAIFDQIGNVQLPSSDASGEEPPYGLRVSFPGKAGAGNATAEVTLTFNSDIVSDARSGTRRTDFETALKGEIAGAMTGVEGFISYVETKKSEAKNQYELAPLPRDARLLGRTVIRFKPKAGGRPIEANVDSRGYYVAPYLPVDHDFGSEYQIEIATKPANTSNLENASEPDIVLKLAEAEGPDVSVRYGARTRRNLTVRVEMADLATRSANATAGLPGAPASISTMFSNFVEGNFLLGQLMQRLPSNPGLHLGGLQIPDAGLQPLWSLRFRFQEPGFDRGPHFVARGTFRLQAFTSQGQESAGNPIYLRISWTARAAAADLDLQTRPVVEGPWGLGVGIVPSVNPVLYTAGISYKVLSVIELYAGAGKQKGRDISFVYGITLDLNDILDGLFGKSQSSTSSVDTEIKSAGLTASDTGRAAAGPPAKTGSRK